MIGVGQPKAKQSRSQAASARAVDHVSNAEIAQLVASALEGALVALGEQDPELALRIQAAEDQTAMRRVLHSLPRVQASDLMVLTEYRKAIVFQNLRLDLALEMVAAIRRYATACTSEVLAETA